MTINIIPLATITPKIYNIEETPDNNETFSDMRIK